MVTQTITVNDASIETIKIGRRATYGTEQIVFDLSWLVENYGSGTAVLMVKRSQDSAAYPASDVEQEDTTLTWTINEVDTSYKGNGECELFWTVTDGLTKTVIYPLVVMRDIGETEAEAPDAYQNWVDTLTALGAETLQNAQDAAQSATDAETAQGLAEDARDEAVTAQGLAEDAQESAETNALKSEGYAVGTQDGTAVVSGSPYYQNNAEYYANVAQQGAEESGYVWFDVHDADGEMYVTITDSLAEDVSFSVNENTGELVIAYV